MTRSRITRSSSRHARIRQGGGGQRREQKWDSSDFEVVEDIEEGDGTERKENGGAKNCADQGSLSYVPRLRRDRRTPEFIILSSRQARQKPISSATTTSHIRLPPATTAATAAPPRAVPHLPHAVSPGQSSWKNPFHRTRSSRP